MKIIYVLDSLINAGVQHHVYRLALGLADKNTIKIICLEKKGLLATQLEDQGIEVVEMDTQAVYKLDSILKIFKLAKLFKNWQPDVVQTFLFKANIMGVIAAWLAGVKVILSGRTNMGYATKTSHYIALKLLDFLTTGTVICSKAIMKNTAKKGKIPWKKLFLIYNGVDPAVFSISKNNQLKSELGIPVNKKIVGIVANIRPVKGYDFFTSAAEKVLKQHPNTHFLVIGNVHDNIDYYNKIKRQIVDNNMLHNFTFLHSCKIIPDVLQIMDITVLSSLSEGFSITLLEYMAAEKPIVVTDVGGNGEAIVSNQSGVLVRSANDHLLSEAIINIINDPQLGNKLAKNARKRVVEKFSLDVIFKEHIKLYQQLLS